MRSTLNWDGEETQNPVLLLVQIVAIEMQIFDIPDWRDFDKK